jgi:hypothetical protein
MMGSVQQMTGTLAGARFREEAEETGMARLVNKRGA